MDDGSLQFDKAEFAEAPAAAATCGYCQKALEGTYYGVDGRPACPRCKDEVAARGTQGSPLSRFMRATLFGTIAGGLGAGLWYAVRAVTSLEIGLISILVGLAVGVAVRAGSYGRGGRLYQALAVFLTYTAIVSTYVPYIVTGLREQMEETEKAGSTGKATVAPGSEATTPATAEPVATTPPESVSAGQAVTGLGLLVVFIFGLAYVAPFLGGFENIIGLAIIAFGLWEAWKINRRAAAEISGPWSVKTPASAPATSPAVTPTGE